MKIKADQNSKVSLVAEALLGLIHRRPLAKIPVSIPRSKFELC